MLTIVEKILFVVAVAASLYFGYKGFAKVYRVIRPGAAGRRRRTLIARAWDALTNWLLLLPTWKVRLAPDLFHAVIAWGFMYYFLVNFGDVLQGYSPASRFLGHGPIGNVYRFLADLLSVGVLVGMIYFLVRRFICQEPGLQVPRERQADAEGGGRRHAPRFADRRRFHPVPRRLALPGRDVLADRGGTGRWHHRRRGSQPFANAVSGLWAGLAPGALNVGDHLFWWLALGTILAFIPYFPYTKHFHLIMSGINFLTKPKRTSLGTLEPINFEDEIDRGVRRRPASRSCPGRTWSTPTPASCATAARMSARPT